MTLCELFYRGIMLHAQLPNTNILPYIIKLLDPFPPSPATQHEHDDDDDDIKVALSHISISPNSAIVRFLLFDFDEKQRTCPLCLIVNVI